MRLLQIRARTNEDAECLMRELAVYTPKRNRRLILLDVEERSQTDLLAMLTAIETCLSANDIPSVRIELDGGRYTMEPTQPLS
jgi:hypothetical protein